MELTQLHKPRLVSSNSLERDRTASWSDYGSHTIPNVLFMGKLAKSRFVIFGEMSYFDKVFKISIELDVNFVKWNRPFFNSNGIHNMVHTAVVKLLKGSK